MLILKTAHEEEILHCYHSLLHQLEDQQDQVHIDLQESTWHLIWSTYDTGQQFVESTAITV